MSALFALEAEPIIDETGFGRPKPIRTTSAAQAGPSKSIPDPYTRAKELKGKEKIVQSAAYSKNAYRRNTVIIIIIAEKVPLLPPIPNFVHLTEREIGIAQAIIPFIREDFYQDCQQKAIDLLNKDPSPFTSKEVWEDFLSAFRKGPFGVDDRESDVGQETQGRARSKLPVFFRSLSPEPPTRSPIISTTEHPSETEFQKLLRLIETQGQQIAQLAKQVNRTPDRPQESESSRR